MSALLANPAFNIFYDAGTLIVICGKPVGAFVTADCWLAAENLMLAATALGLATSPAGMRQICSSEELGQCITCTPGTTCCRICAFLDREAPATPGHDRTDRCPR